MGVPTIKTGPMTVEEYFAFTDTRPDNEKWELIDGEPILNASPSGLHQTIVQNLVVLLGSIQRRQPQSWESIPGIGVRVSETSLPEPDVFILPAGTVRRDPYSRETRDVIVAFEILVALDRGSRSALETHRLYQLAVAHALCRDRAGCGRRRRIRPRVQVLPSADSIARRFARIIVARHFAAAVGNLSRYRIEIARET